MDEQRRQRPVLAEFDDVKMIDPASVDRLAVDRHPPVPTVSIPNPSSVCRIRVTRPSRESSEAVGETTMWRLAVSSTSIAT